MKNDSPATFSIFLPRFFLFWFFDLVSDFAHGLNDFGCQIDKSSWKLVVYLLKGTPCSTKSMSKISPYGFFGDHVDSYGHAYGSMGVPLWDGVSIWLHIATPHGSHGIP